MQKFFKQAAILTLCGAAAIFAGTGCGGGGADDANSNSSAQKTTPAPATGDLAPDSIGNKTVNGHIDGTSTTWQIVTSGGTSGTYQYSENGQHLNDGDYSWVKTSDHSGVLTLNPNNTPLDLNYTAANQGTYVLHANANYDETGTFTTN